MPVYDQVIIASGPNRLNDLCADSEGTNAPIGSKRTLVIGGLKLRRKAERGFSDGPIGRSPDASDAAALRENSAPSWTSSEGLIAIAVDDIAVDRVHRESRSLVVRLVKGDWTDAITADRVIIATGPGPEQNPDTAGKMKHIRGDVGAVAENSPGFPDVIDASSYLPSAQPVGLRVCVEGSSATAAWCVQRAIERKAAAVVWISRSGFLAANPAGRNSEMIKMAKSKGWMYFGRVESITRRKVPSSPAVLELRLAASSVSWTEVLKDVVDTTDKDLEAQKDSVHNLGSRGPTEPNKVRTLKHVDGATTVYVDQYVCASGQSCKADPGAPSFIDPALTRELEPHFDTTRFGHKDTVAAFATADRSLWVVGSAVFPFLKDKRIETLDETLRAVYRRMSDVLCEEDIEASSTSGPNAERSAEIEQALAAQADNV